VLALAIGSGTAHAQGLTLLSLCVRHGCNLQMLGGTPSQLVYGAGVPKFRISTASFV
jgi:hypothetical protein